MVGNWNKKKLALCITWPRMYNNYQGHNQGRDESIDEDDDDDHAGIDDNNINNYFKCMQKVYSIFKISKK